MGGAGGIIVHRCVNSLYSLDSLAALMDRQILRVLFLFFASEDLTEAMEPF